MSWIRRTMLCVDDEASLALAAPAVAGVCRSLGASLVLYHALPPHEPRGLPTDSPPDSAALNLEHPALEGIDVQTVQEPVDHGELIDAITRRAADMDVDLLLVPTHGRTGFGRLVFDSVAERLVRSCRFPVLTFDLGNLEELEDPTFDAVIITTDLSPVSDEAAVKSRALVEKFDAPVVLFHAVDIAYVTPSTPQGVVVPGIDLDVVEEGVRGELERIASEYRRLGIAAEVEVRFGTVVSTLDEVAAGFRRPVVITTTTGRDSIVSHMIGSRAERIIRHLKTPVLSLPTDVTSS